MNVLLVIENGIPSDPILIESESTAKAVYVNLAQGLGANLDIHEIMSVKIFEIVDKALEKSGNSLHWWEVLVNK